MAREMLKDASPEQLERLRELAGRMRRDQNLLGGDGPGDEPSPAVAQRPPSAAEEPGTTPVDARRRPSGPGASERVLAEYYSDRPVDREAAAGPAPTGLFQQAARAAEQAVEQQAVPARHSDLVRRVFRRYASQPAAPASEPSKP